MKTTQDYITELKPIIQPYVQPGIEIDAISEATNFIDDLGINSANLVDIVLDVEDKYDIEIDNDSMERMMTVGAAVEVVKEILCMSS